jgi:four helix bundle protein
MEQKKFLQLKDIEAYRIAFYLSNYVWNIVIKWGYFPRNTVGMQFVDAVDSVSANIAEGFGRYHKKDKVKFYRYSQGSLHECLDWNQKSKTRALLTDEQYDHIFGELQKMPKALNSLILFTNQRLKV